MCSLKKVLLGVSQNSQETLAQVFSCEFCEISKSNFFHRTSLVATSRFWQTKHLQSEAVARRCSVKNVFLEISQNSQETSVLSLWHRFLPVNFAKFLRTLFLTEHLWWLLLAFQSESTLYIFKTSCSKQAQYLKFKWTVDGDSRNRDEGLFPQWGWSLLFYCSSLLLSTFKSQVLKVLSVKFTAFSWQPLLFSYLNLTIPHLICGSRLAVPNLQFYRHPLCKQSLVPVPTIIIRRLKNEFDTFHLLLLNHLDQQIRPKLVFPDLFWYSSTTNTLQLTIDNTLTLMGKAFRIDQKTTWSNG